MVSVSLYVLRGEIFFATECAENTEDKCRPSM